MTTEQKEKTYDVAIKRASHIYQDAFDKDMKNVSNFCDAFQGVIIVVAILLFICILFVGLSSNDDTASTIFYMILLLPYVIGVWFSLRFVDVIRIIATHSINASKQTEQIKKMLEEAVS